MALKNSVRIIGGRWRGRRIAFDASTAIRPTPDRVRETLFNWLMNRIQGAKCLDLFAGSGILGLEALSRGAEQAIFLENDSRAIEGLKAAAALLKLSESQMVIERVDTLKWLSQEKFDVIFLDPPYDANLWSECLSLIKKNNLLAKDGVVYVEADKPLAELIEKAGFNVIKHKQFSAVYASLIKT